MNTIDLLNLRRNGKRPEGNVLATLVPELSRYAPVVNISRGDDLAGFYGLDILLAYSSAQLETALHIIDELLVLQPRNLNTWTLDTGLLVAIVEDGDLEIMRTQPMPALKTLVEQIRCK